MAVRHPVTSLASLPPGTGRVFTVAGQCVALFNAGGRIFAVGGTCPHDGAPLAEGAVDGTTLVCPLHGAEFDLVSGRVLCPPAVENIPSYPVHLDGDRIEVEI